MAFAAILLVNVSCSRDEEVTQPKGAYENGILITNEGNYGKPEAEISYTDFNFSKVENGIYKTVNGTNMGDVLQSVSFSDDKAYFALNNSNKVIITNRYSLKKEKEITQEIDRPRYIAINKDYIYVTNDRYKGAKYVSIYKKSDLSFVKKIDFGTDAAERIVEAGGNIFVQNASYGYGTKMTYIKTSDNTVGSTINIPVGNRNINKIISYNNSVYAITSDAVDSYIYQYSSTGTLEKTTDLKGIKNGNNLVIENGKFYFSDDNKVYAMDMTATTAPTTPLFTVAYSKFFHLYGFNVIDGKIYTSDPKSFTADSEVSVYDTTGKLLKTFTAGMGTNGFYKN